MDGRAGRPKGALCRKPGGWPVPRREEHCGMVIVLRIFPEFRYVILNQSVTRSRRELLSAKPFFGAGRASYALTRFLRERVCQRTKDVQPRAREWLFRLARLAGGRGRKFRGRCARRDGSREGLRLGRSDRVLAGLPRLARRRDRRWQSRPRPRHSLRAQLRAC